MTTVKLSYFGTNSLVIQKGASTLLIDPYFSRPRLLALWVKLNPDPLRIMKGLSLAGVKHVDGVLLTHTHFDHALDVIEVIRQAGGCLVGSQSAMRLARSGGIEEKRCISVSLRELYSIGDFQVQFHPGCHLPFSMPLNWLFPEDGQISENLTIPAHFWAFQCGDTYAIQVEHMLVFGSAGFVPDAYRGLKIQTVVLAVGGLETKPRSYLEQFYQETVRSTGARQVLLSHWDNFFLPSERGLKQLGLSFKIIEQIQELGAVYGQTVQVLAYGETYRV